MADSAKILLDIQLNQQQITAVNQQLANLQQNATKAQEAQQEAQHQAARQAQVLAAGFDETAKRALSVEQAAEQMNRELFEIGRSTAIDQIAADFREAEAQGIRTADAYERVADQLAAIGASEDEVRRTARAIADMREQSDKGGINARSPIGTALLALPGSGAAGFIGQAANTAGTVAQLDSVSALAVGGVLALTTVINTLGEETRRSEQRFAAIIDAQRLYYDVIQEGTKSSIIAERDRAQGQLNVNLELQRLLAQQAAQLGLDILSEGGQILGSAQFFWEKLGLPGATGELKALYEAIATTLDQYPILNAQVDAYNAALISSEVAVNSAAKAQIDYAEAIRGEFDAAVRHELDLQDMTADQRRERIQEIYREGAALQQFGNANRENAVIVKYAEMRITELNAEGIELASITYTVVDAYQHEISEKEKLLTIQQAAYELEYGNKQKLLQIELARSEAMEAVSDSTDAYFDNLTRQTEEAAKASEQWMNAQRDNAQELIDIQAEADSKWEDALLEAADRRQEINDDRQEKLIKAEEDYAKRIEKINRDANRTIAEAVGDRDAEAAHRAEQRRQDELADEADAQKERLKEIEESYQEQTDTIAEYLEDQERKIKQAADRAREIQARRFAEEVRQYQLFQQQQFANTSNNLTQLAAIQISGMQNSLFRTQNYWMAATNIQDVYQNASLFRLQAWWAGILGVFSGGGSIGGGGGGGSPAQITPFSANGAASTPFNRAVDARLAHLQRRAIQR